MKFTVLTLAALLVAGSAQAQTTCRKDDLNPSRTICDGPGGRVVREQNPFGYGDRIVTKRGTYTQETTDGSVWSGAGGTVRRERALNGGTDYSTPQGTYNRQQDLGGGSVYTSPSGRQSHCHKDIYGGQVCDK